ncbi:MAG TPA: lysylphosphatidylglycerol synthase transmembrane domain-containing protein [Acidimicrobiales bacterium]
MAATVTPADEEVGRRNWLRIGIGAAIGLGAVYAVVTAAGGLGDSFDALRHVHVGWLVVAGALEWVSYVFLGLLMRQLSGEKRVSRRAGLRLGFVVLGLGNIMPAAPLEGLTLAGAELRRRDVPVRRVALALGLFQWFITRAMFAFFALSTLAVVVLVEGRHSVPDRYVLGIIAGFVLLTLPVSRYLLSQQSLAEWAAVKLRRLRRKANRLSVQEARLVGRSWHRDAMGILGSSANQFGLVALALAWCSCDAACFRLSLFAAGVPLTAPEFVLGYATAMLGAMVPFVPAGFGAVETAVPALLHRSGTPVAKALAGVLTFRLLGTLLPAVGGAAALVLLRRAKIEQPTTAGG